MSERKIINIGTAELAGDGETLRSAFDKINHNFDDLYAADLSVDAQFLESHPGAFYLDYANFVNTPQIPLDVSDLTDATNLLAVGGIALTDLSVVTNPAGTAALTYDNTLGVFTYTPPDLSGLGGGASYTDSDVDTHLNTSTATANQILAYDGADYTWIAQPSGGVGIALSDLSVTTASAGTAALAYNNTTGVFTYTPPDLSSFSTFDGDYNSLTNQPTIPTAYTDSDVDAHLNQSNPTSGYVLSWNGTDYAWVAQSSGGSGIALSDLSVTTASASGTPSLAYNNSTGVFTYTPPDLSNAIVSTAQYTSTVTSNPADTSDTSAYIFGNTGSASATGSSTGWLFADVVQDPDNPSSSIVLDVDSAILTGDVVGDITSNGTSQFSGTVDFSPGSSVDFTGATVSGISTGAMTASSIGSAAVGAGVTDGNDLAIAGGDATEVNSTGGDANITGGSGALQPGNVNIGASQTKLVTIGSGSNNVDFPNGTAVDFTGATISGFSAGAMTASSIESAAVSADSTDGNTFTIGGGDATGLNSTGGDAVITGGSGALASGDVNIGTTQTTAIAIGASSVGTTVGGTLTTNGNAIFETGIFETFHTISAATGTVAHDCNNGHIFYHTSPAADWTANFTNLGLNANYGTGITLIIAQGATAYIPTAVQTDGVSRTILWQGGSAPTGNANSTDAVSFSILRTSGSYIVLGQLVDFS